MSFALLTILTVAAFATGDAGDVVYAVNAGGGHHVDSNGIHYIADPLTMGVASDYGQRFQIRRTTPEDQGLYQTERWHDESFSYDIPIREEGEYVLVLKFSEVYFDAPEQKIFSVQLNNYHMVVSDLDIYDRVGHATAHDEVISFSIKNGKLHINQDSSSFNSVLTLEFLKGSTDNPKICAFYLMKGLAEEVPALPPLDKLLDKDDEDEDEEDDGDSSFDEKAEKSQSAKPSGDSKKRDKLKSGPPAINPYAEDSSSLILPIIVAFCAFIPTLVCLCRL